ncbi:hypothetical protein M9980_07775 [Sphingomonas donggukensis]|uniref:Uncharacterized protein n=1 Tax=Sphingomonas donggukensis TaxID=2949093 RepID=A0ABY4TRB4_9SPHN|nr:hypothetical protein [Sphingomonas donggukensis]URW74484.1 hypothetical protein M9980_07775 [Sphingomonas donggukensis]
MTGLLAVFVLIVVASVLFNLTNREPPVTAIGAAKPDVVANMTDAPPANTTMSEPLSDLGVLPAATGNSAAGAK